MQKILQPDSKGKDLLMKNFISRHEKEQSDTESLVAAGRYSLYLPTTARIAKLWTLLYTVKRNHPNPRHTKGKRMQGEVQGDCDKNRSRETANPSDLQRADVGKGLVPARFESESTVTFYCVCQKAALEHHMELLCNKERKNNHTRVLPQQPGINLVLTKNYRRGQ